MGADRSRWYHIRKGRMRRKGAEGSTRQDQPLDNTRALSTAGIDLSRDPEYSGAIVARSQIVVSGSTATLSGTMTNETDCHVHFSGMPPYAMPFDTDGSEPTLMGDFSSPPRDQPSSGDWVMHPGASVPYRSLPIALETNDPRWDGTHWCTSSQSTTLDIVTFGHERELPTIQLFHRADPVVDSSAVPLPTPGSSRSQEPSGTE
jgi:hypothetical protein